MERTVEDRIRQRADQKRQIKRARSKEPSRIKRAGSKEPDQKKPQLSGRVAERDLGDVTGTEIPHGASIPAEAVTFDLQQSVPPVHPLEPARDIGSADIIGSAEETDGRPEPATTRPQTPGGAADTAGAEPMLVEAAGGEAAARRSNSAELEPTEFASPETEAAASTMPPLAEAVSAELEPTEFANPETEAAGSTMSEPPFAEAASSEPRRFDHQTIISASSAPLPCTAINPLGFVTAMSSFMRSAAALNIASMSWRMNSYLTCSAGIFDSMMTVRAPAQHKSAKTPDATKAQMP